MGGPVAVLEPPLPAETGTPLAAPRADPSPSGAIEPSTPHPRAQVAKAAVIITAVGLLAGLLLLYEFVLSGIPERRTQAELLAGFKQAVPTTTLDTPSSTPPIGAAVALLSIPRLRISEVVVEGSAPSDLKLGPGHLSASPLPGEYGNAVIEARRTTYGAPFGMIASLHKGDMISVATGQGSFTYAVSRVARLSSGQPDVVGATNDSRLTLLTSDPPLIATGRLAVVAKLKGEPVAIAARPAAPEGAEQLGLAGDPLGLALGLIWLQLLVAASVVGWRVRRRLPHTVLYLFAAPVITTLALLTFANLDSLLPGTL